MKKMIIDLSDIMTSFVSTLYAPNGTISISQEFRLLLKIYSVESIVIDGVEYHR